MNKKSAGGLEAIALAFVLTITGTALAGAKQKQDTTAPSHAQPFASGQQLKTIGIVLKRDADSFVMRDQAGVERAVALTPMTNVKTHKKGVFRGGKSYAVSYILRGLRLEVTGIANSQGQLVADSIKFDDDDLRTAQALQARVDPVEELAKANQARITAAEEEAKRLARESEANAAAAKKAQVTADEARRNADRANNRINGLDD